MDVLLDILMFLKKRKWLLLAFALEQSQASTLTKTKTR